MSHSTAPSKAAKDTGSQLNLSTKSKSNSHQMEKDSSSNLPTTNHVSSFRSGSASNQPIHSSNRKKRKNPNKDGEETKNQKNPRATADIEASRKVTATKKVNNGGSGENGAAAAFSSNRIARPLCVPMVKTFESHEWIIFGCNEKGIPRREDTPLLVHDVRVTSDLLALSLKQMAAKCATLSAEFSSMSATSASVAVEIEYDKYGLEEMNLDRMQAIVTSLPERLKSVATSLSRMTDGHRMSGQAMLAKSLRMLQRINQLQPEQHEKMDDHLDDPIHSDEKNDESRNENEPPRKKQKSRLSAAAAAPVPTSAISHPSQRLQEKEEEQESEQPPPSYHSSYDPSCNDDDADGDSSMSDDSRVCSEPLD